MVLSVAIALGVDWIAAELLTIGSTQTRWWLLCSALILVCGTLAFLLGRVNRAYREFLQETEILIRSETHLLAISSPPGHRDSLTHRGSQVLIHLHDRMRRMARQSEELERERATYKHRAKNFESQSRQVHSVLSALAEPVLVIDKRDQLVLTNSSADLVLCLPKKKPEDRAIASLLQCEQLVDLLTETRKRQAFTQGSHEIELIDAEGTPHWYRVTTRNIPTQPGESDPDGTSQGAVALLHDISAQRTLQKRNAEFVTAVSHEMKTPLAGIKAYVELLADGEAEDVDAQQEFLRVIGTEADRLQYLINDLVELARIEADLAGEHKHMQALIPLLEETLGASSVMADRKRIHLQKDWGQRVLMAAFDRPLVQQAIHHLLTNAVKYSSAGGTITLRAGSTPSGVFCEVIDSGVGMSSSELSKIFEKFYRVPETRHMADGTGLGLPLVKHIIEDVHGGRIEVTSKPGQGSTFRISLPGVTPRIQLQREPATHQSSLGQTQES